MDDELFITLFIAAISCENLDVNRASLEIAKKQLDVFEEKVAIEKELLKAVYRLNENLEGGHVNGGNLQ